MIGGILRPACPLVMSHCLSCSLFRQCDTVLLQTRSYSAADLACLRCLATLQQAGQLPHFPKQCLLEGETETVGVGLLQMRLRRDAAASGCLMTPDRYSTRRICYYWSAVPLENCCTFPPPNDESCVHPTRAYFISGAVHGAGAASALGTLGASVNTVQTLSAG
jgi:hypothetical protein